MARPIVFVGATLIAAALGALASVVVVSLRAPPEPPHDDPVPASTTRPKERRQRPPRRRRGAAVLEKVFSTDTAEIVLPPGSSLSALISSSDEQERLRTARAILRQGVAALPQVRALRPRTPEGEDLARNLVLALQKIQKNERHVDWSRRPPSVQMELRLMAFQIVLPEEMLLVERHEFWLAEVLVVRQRLKAGRATDGQLALVEIEFARVRRELGEIDAAGYAEVVDQRLATASAWVSGLHKQKSIPPARISRYQEQLARLRE